MPLKKKLYQGLPSAKPNNNNEAQSDAYPFLGGDFVGDKVVMGNCETV